MASIRSGKRGSMRAQDAIAQLYFIQEDYCEGTPYDSDAIDMAISALKKQIQKKPVIYKNTHRADCPICGNTVRGIGKKFGNWCSHCGQALDWSEEV